MHQPSLKCSHVHNKNKYCYYCMLEKKVVAVNKHLMSSYEVGVLYNGPSLFFRRRSINMSHPCSSITNYIPIRSEQKQVQMNFILDFFYFYCRAGFASDKRQQTIIVNTNSGCSSDGHWWMDLQFHSLSSQYQIFPSGRWYLLPPSTQVGHTI